MKIYNKIWVLLEKHLEAFYFQSILLKIKIETLFDLRGMLPYAYGTIFLFLVITFQAAYTIKFIYWHVRKIAVIIFTIDRSRSEPKTHAACSIEVDDTVSRRDMNF